MTKLNIRSLAAAAGISNPLVFSKQSGLAYAMCYKLWNDQQSRIDLTTIDRLCDVFRCSPGDLFLRPESGAKPEVNSEDHHLRRQMLSPDGRATAARSVGRRPKCRRIPWID
jgi:DNA-binding Xre family transcriptional regulator